jgi:hypothetical protein
MEFTEQLKKNWGILLVLGTLFLYIILKGLLAGAAWLDMAAGAVIFFEIITLVYLEVKEGVGKHGWKHEIVDTFIAIAIALLIWYGAQFALGTNSPISSVVSCSMLNELQRGDFVIVQGGDITATQVKLTAAEFNSTTRGPFVVSGAGLNATLPVPLYSYCMCNQHQEICTAFFSSPEDFVEVAGPATYHYGWCAKNYGDKLSAKTRCLDYVDLKGKELHLDNKANNVIVYGPRPTDLYASVGDIVHRSVAKLDVDGKTYYLTGGDNNPVLDSQVYDCHGVGNVPPATENVKGKVISKIPYLGYLKLFISGYWGQDEQCSWTIKR